MSTSIETIQNEQVLNDSSIARKINKLLNSSETRIEGLQSLKSFLPVCSDENFLQFCISWMQNCCKADASQKNRDYAIHLLSDFLKFSSNYQELKKSVSFFITTRYFDYFFKYLLNSEAGWNCTESCLLYYRGACGPFQLTLEKHLKSKIIKNVRIPVVIGKCFALMPCVGGVGSEGTNYKKNWKIQFVNFMNICQSILNNLFANVNELQEYETPEYTSYIKKNKSAEELTTILENHVIILNCMLLNQYPAPKNVPSDAVFQLICRGLALNPKVLANQKTAGVISLEKVLPEIQSIFISFLKAVIVSCKSQLLPYSHLICKLIKQILEWTENESERLYGSVRILAYEALCNWLAVARSGSCLESVSGVIVSNALNDIRSKKKVVFLKETKLQNRLKGEDQVIRRGDAAVIKLCHAAIKALQFLLKFVGVLLEPEEHRFLQEALVKLIKEVQKNSFPDVPVPFGAPACRVELYSLLLELICQPNPQWPPPTNYALRLFREGVNDPSSKVSSVCSAALNFAAIIIHPQYDNEGFCSSETSNDRSRTEVELQWTEAEELGEANNEKEGEISQKETAEVEENSLELDERNKSEKLNEFSENSEIFSDEDSRNTVKFLIDSIECTKENVSVNESKTDKASEETLLVNNDEPRAKKRRISTEESTSETTSSPNKEKPTSENASSPYKEKSNESDSNKGTPEKDKVKNTPENIKPEELLSIKNVSPESNEEGQPKTRYYLRSKTKASSEEPEETAKRTSSPEAWKSTPNKNPVKNTSNIQSSKKRPRTRALSKVEANGNAEVKTVEKTNIEENNKDEEDIKASFFDSFID